jgi:hypothetical protein
MAVVGMVAVKIHSNVSSINTVTLVDQYMMDQFFMTFLYHWLCLIIKQQVIKKAIPGYKQNNTRLPAKQHQAANKTAPGYQQNSTKLPAK